jgi:hypothetical protein
VTFRDWIADLFAAPKLIPFLEDELKRERQEHKEHLAEKDARIRELRLELADVKAENDRMRAAETGELARMPHDNAKTMIGPFTLPNPEQPLDWNGELARMLKEEEDGVHGKRREEVDQSGSDDGA